MSELLLLENNGRQNSAQKPIWQHRRSLAISATTAVLLIIVVFGGLYCFWLSPAMKDLVSFTCSSISDNQTSIIYARINLTDGMNQEEAMEVANKVFLEAYKQPTERWALQSLFVNSTCDGEGVWTICFICAYSSPIAHHGGQGAAVLRRTFTVNINPDDQTAIYGG